jgi:hypothetical protein
MILICDFCHSRKKEIIKIPNAFIIEEDFILFPNDPRDKYTNMCVDCIGVRKEDPFV